MNVNCSHRVLKLDKFNLNAIILIRPDRECKITFFVQVRVFD
jgi:hypothetical protein